MVRYNHVLILEPITVTREMGCSHWPELSPVLTLGTERQSAPPKPERLDLQYFSEGTPLVLEAGYFFVVQGPLPIAEHVSSLTLPIHKLINAHRAPIPRHYDHQKAPRNSQVPLLGENRGLKWRRLVLQGKVTVLIRGMY